MKLNCSGFSNQLQLKILSNFYFSKISTVILTAWLLEYDSDHDTKLPRYDSLSQVDFQIDAYKKASLSNQTKVHSILTNQKARSKHQFETPCVYRLTSIGYSSNSFWFHGSIVLQTVVLAFFSCVISDDVQVRNHVKYELLKYFFNISFCVIFFVFWKWDIFWMGFG